MSDYDGRTALVVVDVQNDFADPGGAADLYADGAGSDDLVAGSVLPLVLTADERQPRE